MSNSQETWQQRKVQLAQQPEVRVVDPEAFDSLRFRFDQLESEVSDLAYRLDESLRKLNDRIASLEADLRKLRAAFNYLPGD